jgi:hypothetical protein
MKCTAGVAKSVFGDRPPAFMEQHIYLWSRANLPVWREEAGPAPGKDL